MMAWIFLLFLIAAEVSTGTETCLKNDFAGKGEHDRISRMQMSVVACSI